MADRSTTSFKVSQQASTINVSVSNKVVPPEAKVDLSSVDKNINSISEAQKKLADNQAELNKKINDINVPQDNKSQELADITKALQGLTVALGGLVSKLGKDDKNSTPALIDSETLSLGITTAFTKKETQRGLAEALNRLDVEKRKH